MKAILLVYLAFLKYLECVKLYVSNFNDYRCHHPEENCVGEKSRPFSDIGNCFSYIRTESSNWKQNGEESLEIFFQSNSKDRPYILKGSDEIKFYDDSCTYCFEFFLNFFMPIFFLSFPYRPNYLGGGLIRFKSLHYSKNIGVCLFFQRRHVD